ncbi:MAG TPA: hypothetical protein VFA78_00945 [Chloroflexota bacterium]|nr:hypothetical protein [Chloroflexota bacterium]
MERTPRQRPTDVGAELKAAYAARQELGPAMEDEVIDAFLARIDERLEGHLTSTEPRAQPVARPPKGEQVNPLVPIGTLGVAIPLMAIAGDIAGGVGVVVVILGVVAVNLLYFIDRWVRFG